MTPRQPSGRTACFTGTDEVLDNLFAGRSGVRAIEADATAEHRAEAAARIEVLDAQRDHLVESLDRLLGEIVAGQRPLRVFRQMKMYNDPTMNPYLYKARKAA